MLHPPAFFVLRVAGASPARTAAQRRTRPFFILRDPRRPAAFGDQQFKARGAAMQVVTFGTQSAVRSTCDAARRFTHWQVAAWCCLGYLLVLAAWSAPSPHIGSAPPEPEQEVKAAFLYKFLGYVEWPAAALGSESAPIVIGVLGDDEVADELRGIVANRRIGAHPLEVRRVTASTALDGVHALFIGGGATAALARLAPEAQQRSVLLVTDFDGALEDGSVINLVIVDNRVRFEVSLEAAERSRLKLSSRMLAVAMWVRPPR